ncbi:LuxR C-terminal-related transcriptional regulator [Streptomyces sp. NPDC017979]|uniref:helix-turn-helix transcriptional regulator n=1 Tax=Streptomyces sp. NPDC017979 TaxID=3365024 RepID=UPI0037ADD523
MPDEATVDRFYEISGGNPLLLRALLEDCAEAQDRETDVLDPCVGGLPGSALTHAVTTCLNRSGQLAVTVAEGLAVLGEAPDSALLARLCGLARFSAMQGLRVLRAAGVVTDLGFRHPVVRTVVLENMVPERRRELHRVAARLCYLEGAEASQIAPHLAAAARVDDPWGVGVLRDAAEEALVEDRDLLAIDYLELAHAFCVDPRQRADIRIRSAVVRQRNDPFAAQRAADELLGMLRAGQLTPAQSLATADVFSGCRRIDGVNEALAALRGPGDGAPDGPAGRAAAVIEYCPPWPGFAPGTRNPALEWEGRSAQRGEEGGTAAEELLRRTVLTDSTLATVGNAVRCLVYTGRPAAARHWVDVFVREAERRGADGWYAMFAGIRAELALMTGDLPAAERYAREGLERLPKQKLGTLAGGLVATQVLALTRMGEYEAGARLFEQPVPEDLFTSEHGLTYLCARGYYNLVTNRLSSALNDFLAIGRRVRDWGIDQPQWIPWRGEAAEALLRLGETTEAEQLLSEQLSLLPAGHERVRGVTLRLFSQTVEVRRRPALLVRAVALLQSAGDRLQLAQALGELAESYCWLGEDGRAWAALSQARGLAEECGAEHLREALLLHQGPIRSEGARADGSYEDQLARAVAQEVVSNQWDGGWRATLSNSEKRVAALAAGGHTNRDISSQLHITVSTVEQHLTRIYRKLRIRGRDQLPVDLQFCDGPTTSTPCRTLP